MSTVDSERTGALSESTINTGGAWWTLAWLAISVGASLLLAGSCSCAWPAAAPLLATGSAPNNAAADGMGGSALAGLATGGFDGSGAGAGAGSGRKNALAVLAKA
jgi:hypothetical protein